MQLAQSAPNHLKPANFKASRGWLFRLRKRLKISRRKCTHRLQQYVEGLVPQVYKYLAQLEELRQATSEDFVFINLDEIPFFFDVSADYTLNLQGEKNIEILSHRNSKTRATFMPAICSNGHSLPPLFVFIYKYTGASTRTFPKKYEHLRNLTRPYMVRFTEEGFTREELIIEYIEKFILPYQESLREADQMVKTKVVRS